MDAHTTVFSTQSTQIADCRVLAVPCAGDNTHTTSLKRVELLEKSVVGLESLCHFMPEGWAQRLITRPTPDGGAISVAGAIFLLPGSYITIPED